MDRGWTNRPVITLKTNELLEETKQATYDTGYYSGKWDCVDLLKSAIARREECFAEIKDRLNGREA